MKNLLKIIILVSVSLLISNTFAESSQASPPTVNCIGLPGCVNDKIAEPRPATNLSKNVSLKWIGNIIGESIQYISVLAVICLMLAGFFYIFSGGDDEKAKKAKNWIIWALVGVILSISAWGIIGMINKINIP